jgi:hypothetical protein
MTVNPEAIARAESVCADAIRLKSALLMGYVTDANVRQSMQLLGSIKAGATYCEAALWMSKMEVEG